MKGIIILFGASLIWLSSCAQDPKEGTEVETTASTEQSSVTCKRVTKEEFKTVLAENPEAQLVDVRTSKEYSNGKIGDAVNIDFLESSFENKISELDKTKLTLIYCQAGGRSAKALAKMKALGFVNVLELEGGYGHW